MRRLRALERRASIRLRVALVAGGLALTSLGAIGYVQLTSTADSLSGAATDQAATLARQLSSALAGSGQAVANVIPFTPRGLDGVVMVDSSGHVTAGAGSLRPTLVRLAPTAGRVAHTRRALVELRVPGRAGTSARVDRLTAFSRDSTIAVAMVPQDGGGAIVTGLHANWATEKLRTTAYSTGLSLSGGVLFIAFGLMLLLGRLVTTPVARLASEVRQLGEGRLATALSSQRTPELQQLAADISQMRDDLLDAVREAATDPLTGVANTRAFHERLEAAAEHSARTGEPLALIAIDLNKLKQINDRFGHAAGDRVISAVVGQIAGSCAPGMVCARIGGDEFAVLCSEATHAGATTYAERMRAAVAALSPEALLGSADAEISISVGVADMPAGAQSKDALLQQADAALYQMKGGRGAPEPSPSPSIPDVSRTVRALAVAVDAKDSGTHSHSQTVAAYAAAIGRRLGMDDGEIERLERAALLHDVGKIGVPDAVLMKPGRLTDEEFAVMQRHSVLGYRILVNGGLPADEALWVLHHHEHLDGSGYPHGLRGDEIPRESRIMLVADAFEAMTSDRPYRDARPTSAAIAELRRCAGRQFDPTAVDALVSLIDARRPDARELPDALFDRLVPKETPA